MGTIKAVEKGKLLIVDPEKKNVDLFKSEFQDYTIYEAINGIDAVKMAIEKEPDLILLNDDIPHMDGHHVCELLKNNSKTEHLPVILSTSKKDKNYIKTGLEKGASDYILKPLDLDILRPKIETHVKLKQSRDELQDVNEFLSIILELAPMIIFVVNQDLEITKINKETVDKLGYKEKQIIGKKIHEFVSNKELIEQIIASGDGNAMSEVEIGIKNKKGEIIPFELRGKKFMENGEFKFYFGFGIDITKRKQFEDELKKAATRDPLTNLYNRGFFQIELEKCVNEAKRHFRPLSLIMFDIDHFKYYNDTYGHLEGDHVLATFGNLIIENIRKIDIACRYGGEEIILILKETPIEHAVTIAERIRNKFSQIEFNPQPNKKVSVTLSGGVTQYKLEDPADNVKSFIERADINLYKAKRAGRNQIISDISFVQRIFTPIK